MNFLEYIQFIGYEDLDPINCTAIDHNNHLVTIVFNNNRPDDNKIITSGYRLLNPSDEFEDMTGDIYTSYTTLYQDIDENTVILSNDGSVYVEPEPIPEPEPYVPTLDDVKTAKIQELSSICKEYIINGVYVEIDSKTEHFSYSEEDQVNIKELFDLSVQTNVPLYYHPDGGSCKLYTVEQIATIYATNATNKMHHITYFNQLKLYVNTLESTDDVENIKYGNELTGIYLDTYNNAMAQAKVGLDTFMGGGE